MGRGILEREIATGTGKGRSRGRERFGMRNWRITKAEKSHGLQAGDPGKPVP